MAASRKSLEKIKELEVKRRDDSDARRKWEALVLAYDEQNGTQTPPDPTGPQLAALIENLAEAQDERGKNGGSEKRGKKSHHDLDDCCGRGDDADNVLDRINMENLAERVFERLIFEVRIERERVGRSA